MEESSLPEATNCLRRWAIYAVAGLFLLIFFESFARLVFQSPYEGLKARPYVPHYQPDSKLGWKNKPGIYAVDFADQDQARTIRVEIGAHGERVSHGNTKMAPEIDYLFLGDSWTFGEAVQGEETFAGKVAKALPKKRVVNLGVGGYSTYQSLSALETLDWARLNPKHVLYGLLSFHEVRNTATHGWVRSLSRSTQGRLGTLPYVRLSSVEGELQRLKRKISFPTTLCHFSRLLCVGLHSYWRMEDGAHKEEQRMATIMLLERMNKFVQQRKAKFTVLLLDIDSWHYESYLRNLQIDSIKLTGPINRLPYDAHPGFDFYSRAAQCILEKVASRVQKSAISGYP